ncbi:polysaccharide pyruvyl transferase family protein [Salinibacter pepae]|uniref:polysaccharide pyruvyl transferase family protein n=1 Tax=Salinibacter pepae TaxID=3040382 RepID=UPI0021E7C5C6|nr:polysaccharide pyruvyl transferase family protein [Salinibacter pepae]
MTVKQLLKNIQGEKVWYCPNPGNAGDALIAEGTFQMLERLNIKYNTIHKDQNVNLKGEVVIYGGGGSFTTRYGHVKQFIEKHRGQAKRIIVLPQSIQGNKNFIYSLGGNVDIFARERYSYEHAKKSSKNANVYIDQDMALNIDVQKVISKAKCGILCMSLESFVKKMVGYKKGFYVPFKKNMSFCYNYISNSIIDNDDVLNFYRKDSESIMEKVPENNIDVSDLFTTGVFNKHTALASSYFFLKFVNRYSVINTDRLHGAIGSMLLKKEVNFYPNDYHKSVGVYEYSIEGEYDKISWHG